MTQAERILEVLKKHPEGLSHGELNEAVHIPATSKRIADLRAQGYEIECVPIKGRAYGRYILRGEKNGSVRQDEVDRVGEGSPGIGREGEDFGVSNRPVLYHAYRCPTCGKIEKLPDGANAVCEACNYRTRMLRIPSKESL